VVHGSDHKQELISRMPTGSCRAISRVLDLESPVSRTADAYRGRRQLPIHRCKWRSPVGPYRFPHQAPSGEPAARCRNRLREVSAWCPASVVAQCALGRSIFWLGRPRPKSQQKPRSVRVHRHRTYRTAATPVNAQSGNAILAFDRLRLPSPMPTRCSSCSFMPYPAVFLRPRRKRDFVSSGQAAKRGFGLYAVIGRFPVCQGDR
jgi:hypothetical protein